jgi:hypothetical protein
MKFSRLLVGSFLVLAACSGQSGGGSATGVDRFDSTSPFDKAEFDYPFDPFTVFAGDVRWLKFSVLTDSPTVAHFQDGRKYVFHYDFAKDALPGFADLTREQFDAASLRREGRRVTTGAVLMPTQGGFAEIGVQLNGTDPFVREEVKALVELVRASAKVTGGPAPKVFYFPTFEQAEAAERDRAWLLENGIEIGSPTRWTRGDQCYAPGWAFGRARFVEGGQIEEAFRDGRLRSDDVLVTDGVPAEVPPVAGIVALRPSTPNSHVAILANTFGIPFAHPTREGAAERARALDGREVVVRAASDGESCALEVVPLEGRLDDAARAELAALKRPAPVAIARRERAGVLARPAEQLRPSDVKFFGGKASNFGTLRRTIPGNSPAAIGISFDLWEDFLAQDVDGKPLSAHVGERLAGLTWPTDVRALEARLDEIRALIKDRATFAPAQRAAVLEALAAAGFDPAKKIRFRSSTNVEDGETMSGAGLYDSFSGCLADETDGDEAGPSACDAGDRKEKGVFAAIRKVYASFYNTNAVIERLRRGIDEADVGMALAVHPSFPDELEFANGVATATLEGGNVRFELVTQAGAESVTNPVAPAAPEVVHVDLFSFSPEPLVQVRQGSDLVPLGQTVLDLDKDYAALALLMRTVAQGFVADRPGAGTGDGLVLDFEYKKLTDGSLVIKQVRAVPRSGDTAPAVSFLFNRPTRLCTFQGEAGTVLGNHRLKQRWTLGTVNARLTDATLGASLFDAAEVEYLDGDKVAKRSGALATLPGANHRVEAQGDFASLVDGFAIHADGRAQSFTTSLQRSVAPPALPILFSSDLDLRGEAQYLAPQPELGFEGPTSTTTDFVLFHECPEDTPAVDDVALRNAERGGVKVVTAFRYRRPESAIEKTSPLGRWEQTEITGLTSSPIVLKGFFSQTFRPQHHNFTEDFVFEPELEEGLDPAVAAELRAQDVRALVVEGVSGFDSTGFKLFKVLRSTGALVPIE